MSKPSRDEVLKRMSDLLRSGATMLDQSCPLCGSPLFKLKTGEIVCPVHGPVRIVKSEAEAVEATTDAVIGELEKIVTYRIHQIIQEERAIQGNLPPHTLDEIDRLLTILEKIKRIRKI